MNWPVIYLIGEIFLFVWFPPAFIMLLLEKQTRSNVTMGLKNIFKRGKRKEGFGITGKFILLCCLGLFTVLVIKIGPPQPEQKH